MKKHLICLLLLLITACLALGGFRQLEKAAVLLPEAVCYINPSGETSHLVPAEALDSLPIDGYLLEGEQILFILFSKAIPSPDKAEAQLLPLAGPGVQGQILSLEDLAQMIRQLGVFFQLLLVLCALAILYGVTLQVLERFWKEFTTLKRALLILTLCLAFLGMFWWDIRAWKAVNIPDVFLPSDSFFNFPFYASQIRWAMNGVRWAKPFIGTIGIERPLCTGILLLIGAVMGMAVTGFLVLKAVRKTEKD